MLIDFLFWRRHHWKEHWSPSSPLSSCSFTLGVLISPSRSHVCTWRTWHGCTHPASLLEIGNLGSADDHHNFGHKGDDGDDDLIFDDDYDHCENWHFTAHLRVCYKPQTRCGIFHLMVIIMIIDYHDHHHHHDHLLAGGVELFWIYACALDQPLLWQVCEDNGDTEVMLTWLCWWQDLEHLVLWAGRRRVSLP